MVEVSEIMFALFYTQHSQMMILLTMVWDTYVHNCTLRCKPQVVLPTVWISEVRVGLHFCYMVKQFRDES